MLNVFLLLLQVLLDDIKTNKIKLVIVIKKHGSSSFKTKTLTNSFFRSQKPVNMNCIIRQIGFHLIWGHASQIKWWSKKCIHLQDDNEFHLRQFMTHSKVKVQDPKIKQTCSKLVQNKDVPARRDLVRFIEPKQRL